MADVHARPVPWREVFAGSLGRVALGLFLLEILTAVQILVVATVMPVVARDLHGLSLYGWAFSAGGLATVVTIPLGGRAVDQVGPRTPFVLSLVVFGMGTLVSGLAPTMPIFITGRFLQGCGAGAEYAVGLGAVAKAFPESHRARVLALIAVAWVLPGLLGPSYGALLASTIGWRWAFLTIVPLLAGPGWLAVRGLSDIEVERSDEPALGLRRPLLLAGGAALLLAGLTRPSGWSIPLGVIGLLAGVPAAVALVRSGSGRPGLAAGLVAGFLVTFAFFGVDGFVPLMLTGLRRRTVGEASIVVTLATVSWSAGSWWQSRVAQRIRASMLVGGGAALICVGAVGVAAGLLDAVPLVVPYVAWAVAGLGIGVAYPTVYLVTMNQAGRGAEGTTVSLLLLLDSLGVATGTGLGGAAISVARSAGGSLRDGLAAAFALALAVGLGLVAIARSVRGVRTSDA